MEAMSLGTYDSALTGQLCLAESPSAAAELAQVLVTVLTVHRFPLPSALFLAQNPLSGFKGLLVALAIAPFLTHPPGNCSYLSVSLVRAGRHRSGQQELCDR